MLPMQTKSHETEQSNTHTFIPCRYIQRKYVTLYN